MSAEFVRTCLLLGSLQAVLLFAYFIFISRLRGVCYFGVVMLLLALHLFIIANDNPVFFYNYPHLMHISWFLSGFYGPLVLIFVRRITRYALKPSWKELLYFAPVVSIMLAHASFFIQSTEAKRIYLSNYAQWIADDFGWLTAAAIWILMIFFSVSLWLFQKYQSKASNYLAVEESRLTWLKTFLLLGLVLTAFGLIAFYGRKYQVPYLGLFYPNHFLGVMLLIYWSAFKLIKQPVLFQSTDSELDFTEEDEEEPEKMVSPQHRDLAVKMNQLMQEEQLYKTPGLTLYDLVKRLNSNKQYVSESINMVFGKNFYDYVNEYRLNDFIEGMTNDQNKHLTMLAIAYEAGFNSKATFNAVFKKHFGVSPSHYFKNQPKKRSELINSDD